MTAENTVSEECATMGQEAYFVIEVELVIYSTVQNLKEKRRKDIGLQ